MKNVKGETIEIRRMITECCPGYGMSESICKPVCANGCFRGRCVKPDKCGCYPGWKGNSCEETCSPGYYGPNCINKCLCKNNALCSPTTGDCTCTKDWKGKLCDIPSSNNSYVYNCSINSECQNEGECNSMNGACNCKPGYSGKTCNETCSPERWGLNCSRKCSCKNGAKCYPVNGTCICTADFEDFKFGNCVHLVFFQKTIRRRKRRSHPPQCTTSFEDRQIVRMAVTSPAVAQHIQSVTHHSVSERTIRHRLQQSGLSGKRPLLGLPLTQNHKRLRHQWVR
ncbi:multiple epidermal growth factor-like domains protein 10 [Trichonephila clavipes]|nr:multiple epidermal growth factor-like domains protein 10 [Trichonephila clavipes]